MHFHHPSLRGTKSKSPRQQNPDERALRRRSACVMLRRALWRVGAVLIYTAVAVIALYGAHLA
jgi:hypothetical protein